jgi:hypothetical protein
MDTFVQDWDAAGEAIIVLIGLLLAAWISEKK